MRERTQKSNSPPMLRATILVSFVDFLEGIGAPAQRLLEDVGISPGLLENAESVAPLHQSLCFARHAAETQGLPALGLRAGLTAQIEQLGAFGRLIRGALTVHEGLNRLSAAIQFVNTSAQLWLDFGADGQTVRFCHTTSSTGLTGPQQGGIFAVGTMIQMVQSMLGRTWRPDAVILSNVEAPYRSSCEALLGLPVRYAGGLQAIEFRRLLLAARPVACGTPSASFQDDYAYLRSTTAPAHDFARLIRCVIASLMIDRYPSIELAAEAIGLTPRTLQRRLAETGESYSHLVDAERFEMASGLLKGDDTKIIDVAYTLGYGDAANFTRAFHRWTGMTPQAYRRLQGSAYAP